MRTEGVRMIGVYGVSVYVTITGWINNQQVQDEILASHAMVLPSFLKVFQ